MVDNTQKTLDGSKKSGKTIKKDEDDGGYETVPDMTPEQLAKAIEPKHET